MWITGCSFCICNWVSIEKRQIVGQQNCENIFKQEILLMKIALKLQVH